MVLAEPQIITLDEWEAGELSVEYDDKEPQEVRLIAKTDDQGHFRIDHVAPGKYQLAPIGATLTMFAVFLAWSVKIIVAWA